MFTGLIREIGRVETIRRRSEGLALKVACQETAPEASSGDSIAVDGACLTVETVSGEGLTFFVSRETVDKSTLALLRPGDRVNIEPSLRVSDRLDGHLVQGHVEGLARITAFERTGEGAELSVVVPSDLLPFIVEKGSIALSGVSLTVARFQGGIATVALVPTTLKATTLGEKKAGDSLNVETDLVARHVVGYMRQTGRGSGLSIDDLKEKGF
jgi:riboflavin synthase